MSMRDRFVEATTRVGAGLGWAATYLPPTRWTMGPRSRHWEPLRRTASRVLGRWFDERAGAREITYGEYAGRFEGPLTDLESLLWVRGFRRNPLSRLKTRDGHPEDGSWALRDHALADRQLHLMLFVDNGVEVYAHEEASSVNPMLGPDHFDGEPMHVAAGVERARDLLPLVTEDAPENPPAGHWRSGPATASAERDHRRGDNGTGGQ